MGIPAVLHKDLIGSVVRVRFKQDNRLVEGKVIDETRETLIMDSGIKIIKDHVFITIQGHEVDGRLLRTRPEDRMKLRLQ